MTMSISAPVSARLSVSVRLPHVLADHDAEPHAAEDDRARRRTGGEDALLVEDAVIRQVVLEAQRRDLAAVEQQRRVIELAVLAPGRADAAPPARLVVSRGEFADRRLAGGDEGRLQHQILGRIAGDEKLGGDDEIGMRGLRLAPCVPEAAEICRRYRRRSDRAGR